MRKAKAFIAVTAIAAAVLTNWFGREQNRQLVQEIEALRQENARLESAAASVVQPIQSVSSPAPQATESELLRLRGAAARAARAEAESIELRREITRLKAPASSAPDSALESRDSLTSYLGTPVEAPANIDPRYTKEGLATAIQLAAQKAGISLRQVSIDDSEYPFLTGVVTESGDWDKLKAQLRTLDGYEFHGSVGDDSTHTFCPVPSAAYPAGFGRRITRRINARLELFYNSFTSPGN